MSECASECVCVRCSGGRLYIPGLLVLCISSWHLFLVCVWSQAVVSLWMDCQQVLLSGDIAPGGNPADMLDFMGGMDVSSQVTSGSGSHCPISEVSVLEVASPPGERRSGHSPDCGL